MSTLSTVIIGGGPGGLGPLVWAAQQGLLPAWLDRGVAVVERQNHLGGTLGKFGIYSDSLGGSYLECLEWPDLPEALRRLRDDPVTREMATYRDGFPPLTLVDLFMRRIGSALASMLNGRSALYLASDARAVRLCEDGSAVVDVVRADGAGLTLSARAVVVALGGRQHWPQMTLTPELPLHNTQAQHVMPSDLLLTTEGLKQADALIAGAGQRRILILGGSHSAYAVAGALLELPAAANLAPGQIVILQRREPRIFYPDHKAASEDRYEVDVGDICPRTQRVNRMGGLRGYGREMWRRITDRPGILSEPRVVRRPLQALSTAELQAEIRTAALAVPCFGYRSATMPILDKDGTALTLSAETGGVAVGDDCRLLTTDGRSLPNLFGIGLGTGYKLPAGMGGEPNFDGQANSLWLYQNDIGAVIYRAIDDMTRDLATQPSPDVVRDRHGFQRAGVAVLAGPHARL